MQTIQETIQQLHNALSDYIEATYHISAPTLIEQRKELLGVPEVVHQIPYLESTPRYETGEKFSEIENLHEASLEIYQLLAKESSGHPRLLYDPPYKHQSQAIKSTLIDGNNLVVMTGTGSGKTESFLLPIIGKLAREAKSKPESFAKDLGMRALILYPMNALVNDQLGRLRALFGDPRLVSLFESWSGRPPRFARYTSRTPYAGVRESKKDTQKLSGFDHFYVDLLHRAENGSEKEKTEARRLLAQLRSRGKWPAKPDLAAWYGDKGSRWQDASTGDFIRAVTLPHDSELLTRHEIQNSPPDLLVTNYSMLEYMLMRPIERPIFDATRDWLEKNPDEKFLLVLDEAHLYRGASGAEVGLLLRRLRQRLGIPTGRFQVICATASFNDSTYAPEFGSQLSGVPSSTFVPITGNLDYRPHASVGSLKEAEILASINLTDFYEATSDAEKVKLVSVLLEYRNIDSQDSVETLLFQALKDFGPMGLVINDTMQKARAIKKLGEIIFPNIDIQLANKAVTVLMSLGSIARKEPDSPGLLPCRIHNFFRGLAGLWVCLDPDCSELAEEHKDGICGKMYSQPIDFCGCGARVLEFFTCRNCGTAHARAYTDDIDAPTMLWSEPGRRLRIAGHETTPLLPVELLLEEPVKEELAEIFDYDLETGRLNSPIAGSRVRSVYLCESRKSPAEDPSDEESETVFDIEERGKFRPCAVCGTTGSYGRSSIMDHQTKGDEPFRALVSRQIEIQPPGPMSETIFAPLRGRKVLTFSDSRQVAARLAPNLQNFSTRDSLRPLILFGYRELQSVSVLEHNLSLEDLYLAVLLAAIKLGVRLRPETKPGESFSAFDKVQNAYDNGLNDTSLLSLCMNLRTERAPEALLENMVKTILDKYLGFEALALASIVERKEHTNSIIQLPNIEGFIESNEEKICLVRAWLRCWQKDGFWLNSMPNVWSNRARAEGFSVKARKGKITAIEKVFSDKKAKRIFDKEWHPELIKIFTETVEHGQRLRGSELTLLIDGNWVRCNSCKSVHRPSTGISHCLDCQSTNIYELNPDEDPVFIARKGYYRKPAISVLQDSSKKPMALIAAEHTAQLNAPQNEDIFSKAEENELLFQDVELNWATRGNRATAIDVLSSTTTMEVGIDLGALSGVALRNMPPARANYQQRAGRAGRRGNAIATVLAFGSADTHDEHYFTLPEGMICGDVVDPRLTLNNKDIVKRHIRAFLLQNYHQDRIPQIDTSQSHSLFSVLGTVADFRSGEGILNRNDFSNWLNDNELSLKQSIESWIPHELSENDKNDLLEHFKEDCLLAVDDAIGFQTITECNDDSDLSDLFVPAESGSEVGDEIQRQNINTLLDRLLYCGKLPRYAFPTDVAAFNVFDRVRSTVFRPIMRFAPQQGLPIALTQYAPGKQVWIAGKCYTSGAVYSVIDEERRNAWSSKRRYLECNRCGFAKTEESENVERGEILDCPACRSNRSFGPARDWMRPPGFAHPFDTDEVTSPDEIPETSYATRAKLTMGSPPDDQGWISINDRIRVFSVRQHLLVSNTGPKKEGYSYCTKCGRIEAHTATDPILTGAHRKPFPTKDNDAICEGDRTSRHIVLGTDFITDIALFSMHVESPLRLRPGHYTTDVALRTVSEALALAACQLLEIEPGELMAEFRPALTPPGSEGLEAEIFLYDTLPGGAGFSTQLYSRGNELFHLALKIMKTCPQDCDSSCYRCLRSFKNKFEHGLLDRHVGRELLEYLLTGSIIEFDSRRMEKSIAVLRDDIQRNCEGIKIEENVKIILPDGTNYVLPLQISRKDGAVKTGVIVCAPLETDLSSSDLIQNIEDHEKNYRVGVINELTIRGNLPDATTEVINALFE